MFDTGPFSAYPTQESDTYDNPYIADDPYYPANSDLGYAGDTTSVPRNIGMRYMRPYGYARGGRVTNDNSYARWAEKIRQKGGGQDTILAHINPLEAMLLKKLGGSGRINETTGLPQYGIKNFGKWLKGSLGGGLGAILGNMVMPGLGGIVGGALGGAAGSAVRGRKDGLSAALRGGALGAALPGLASVGGSLAGSLGFNGLGSTLGNYGSANAILPALGLGGGAGDGMPTVLSSAANSPVAVDATGKAVGASLPVAGTAAGSPLSFTDSLISNGKNFLSKPQNLLALAAAGSALAARPPKEKSAKARALEQKELEKAMRLTPEEMAEKEAYLLSEEQMRRRIARNKFLPEERLGAIEPLYIKSVGPKKQKKTGRWLEYYDNPDFTGQPLPFKKGGHVNRPKEAEMIIIQSSGPTGGLGSFIGGCTGGQDDKVPAMLSDGEFVISADVVSHLGDGNNKAGAKKLKEMMNNIRMHKGGSVKFPPKAKSLSDYLGA